MRKYFYLFFIIFSFAGVSAKDKLLCPENKEVDQLLDRATALHNDGKTKEAIGVLQKTIDLSKSTGCDKGELAATKNMMLVYSHNYDYKKALEISERVKELALNQKNYKVLTTLYGTRATLYDEMGLFDESLKEYETSLKYARLISDADRSHFEISLIYYNLTPFYQTRDDDKVLYYLEKSREEVLKVNDNSEEVPLDKKIDMLISVNMNLGIFYRASKNKRRDMKKSEYYFMEALKYLNTMKGEVSPYTKIDLYEALLEFYKEKKDYRKSIDYGEAMLKLEKSNSMPYNRRVGYMVLAKSYLGIGDSKTSQKYLDLFTKLNDSITTIEKEAVEVPVKKIISETKKSSDSMIKKIAFLSLGFLVIIMVVMIIYRKRSNKILHTKYQKIIAKLNSEKENTRKDADEPIEAESNNELQTASHKNTIPDDTKARILKGLAAFEKSEKFLKKDLTMGALATQLNTNTKYLSEAIKNNRSQNFSNYINSLRINYIVHKLYNEPKYREYKISYLAEECGYASSQVFVIAFKKIHGLTPSYFIQSLKDDQVNTVVSEDKIS